MAMQPAVTRRFGTSRGWFAVLAVGLAFAILLSSYLAFIWPWMMHWGATDAEIAMLLPGDELVPNPSYVSTRAVTIHAPASEVWKWLIQIGQNRAGFYSYTWLENLFSADIHNTDVIVPEWQERQIGDFVPMARADILGGRLGDAAGVYVVGLELERAIVYGDGGTYALSPIGEENTRLIVRDRRATVGIAQRVMLELLWDPAHFVMQRRQLLGIKERAEGTVGLPSMRYVIASVGWVTAVLGTAVLFFARRRWWPWLGLPLALALMTFSPTGDVLAAATGFISLGLVILGGLAFGRKGWPGFLALASFVLLVLLFSVDAYLMFGFLFVLAALAAFAIWAVTPRGQQGSSPAPS